MLWCHCFLVFCAGSLPREAVWLHELPGHAVTVEAPGGQNAVACGDIDGDGNGDFLLSMNADSENPLAIIYPSDLTPGVLDWRSPVLQPTTFFRPGFLPPGVTFYPSPATTVGDIDGDGYTDLLLGSSFRAGTPTGLEPSLYLVFGGPDWKGINYGLGEEILDDMRGTKCARRWWSPGGIRAIPCRRSLSIRTGRHSFPW